MFFAALFSVEIGCQNIILKKKQEKELFRLIYN